MSPKCAACAEVLFPTDTCYCAECSAEGEREAVEAALAAPQTATLFVSTARLAERGLLLGHGIERAGLTPDVCRELIKLADLEERGS